MKKLLSFFVLIFLCSDCAKDEVVTFGSISGVIKDVQTRQPLEGVSVSLEPGGTRKVTGTDGAYSFVALDAGEYTLTYAKAEYSAQSKTSNVQAGVNAIVDITLEREPLIPVLKVSRESLDFGKDTEPLSLDISNAGKGVLNWSIVQTSDWFTCSPMAGTTEKEKSSVVVTVSRNQKEKGAYRQTFSITSNGGSRDIMVTMEVGGVNLDWEPAELDFGTLTSSLPLTLTNRDAGTVDYTAATSNSWIVLGKSSGKITTTDYINVMVNRGTLSPGAYTGAVTIQSGNESFAVPVKMSIAANEKPVVSLNAVTGITYNSATLSGLMVSVGSQKVTRYGFCWGVSPNPTLADASSNLGDCSAPVSFEGVIPNLEPDTKYYVRTYAENAVGLSYSASGLSFTTTGLPSLGTVSVSGVLISPATLSKQVGDPAVTLAATVLPSNATNKNVAWSSNNPGVATVSNGVVSFTGAGSATITLTTVDGNKTATCMVTVTPTAPVTVPVSGVSLNQTSLSLAAGTTGQLAATVLPANATNQNVTWSSSNAGVAVVSATGLVTAQSAGTATITVTSQDGNKTATCLVTVTPTAPVQVPVTGVSLNQTSLSLAAGATGQLAATILPANATNRNVGWSSSNTGVAVVSTTGLVTAQSAGTATITVTSQDGNKTVTCLVTVTPAAPANVPVSGVTLNQATLSLAAGTTGQLAATVSPSNATNKNVGWSSSNTGVATVSATGLVTAKSAGTATITVTTQDGNKTATCPVTVTPAAPVNIPVSGVTLNQATLSLTAGATGQLAATVSPANATNKNVTWSSSNAGVATVSATGLVTAQSAGTATITVRTADGNKTATCTVTVTAATVPVSGVSLNQTSLSLAAGATGQLTATVSPANATNKNVGWSSSYTGVATVSAAGLVTAQSAGTATITVTTQDGNKTATCNVTVIPATVSVSGVSLNQASLSLAAGVTWQLTATVSPANATNTNVGWSSSNTGVATVSATGLVTAQSTGTATITVTTQDGNKTVTCTVTVAVPPVGSVNYDMVAVGGGTFTMGCTSEQGDDCWGDEKPAHQVTLSTFYIGKYEVTQKQWQAVMGTDVRQQAGTSSLYGEGDNYPMYYVSWNEVQEFIQKLNAQTGKTYRLPTEAEWEYAARGGAQSQRYKYSGSNTVDNVAWYYYNSGNTTHPVGQKSPNELGIHDMSGNVLEWCSDRSGTYSSSSQTNPAGPSYGSYRVIRGGSWYDFARDVRVPSRFGYTPDNRYFILGFRLASSSQ